MWNLEFVITVRLKPDTTINDTHSKFQIPNS